MSPTALSAPRWEGLTDTALSCEEAVETVANIPTDLIFDLDDDDECSRHNNTVRAARAARALLKYSDQLDDDDQLHEDLICGLITDLRHLCDALGVDFARASIDDHYRYEADGEPKSASLSITQPALTAHREVRTIHGPRPVPSDGQHRRDREGRTTRSLRRQP